MNRNARVKEARPLVLLVGLDWMVARQVAKAVRSQLKFRTITFHTEHAFRVWWGRNAKRNIKTIVLGILFP